MLGRQKASFLSLHCTGSQLPFLPCASAQQHFSTDVQGWQQSDPCSLFRHPSRKQPNGRLICFTNDYMKSKYFCNFSHRWERRAQHCVKQTLCCFSKCPSLYFRSPTKSVRPCSSRPCSRSFGGQQSVLSFICVHRHILFITTECACPNHQDHKPSSCVQSVFLPASTACCTLRQQAVTCLAWEAASVLGACTGPCTALEAKWHQALLGCLYIIAMQVLAANDPAQLNVIFNVVSLLKHCTLGPPVYFITLSSSPVLSNTKEKIVSNLTTPKYYLNCSFMP